MKILDVKNLKKVYGSKNSLQTEALKNVNFSVDEGEFVSIMGESGSGKTTLLNIISTLDKATNGTVFLKDREISSLKDSEVSSFRRNNLGFVFQDFNLLDNFNNRDNIFLPLVLSGENYNTMKSKLKEISSVLGINELLDKYPYEISGGQKQRIAVARAIITKPDLILADEPTGALDSNSSDILLKLFKTVNESGQTILMVTHSLKAASFSKRVLFIKDGIVYHEIYRGDENNQEFAERIILVQNMLNRGDRDEI